MEVCRDPGACRQSERTADAAATRVARTVYRCVHDGRLAAYVLHDVDLPAHRPVDTVEACTEHPERRPDPLSGRQPHARLDAPELCGESPLRLEACGRIGGAVPLRADHRGSPTSEVHV